MTWTGVNYDLHRYKTSLLLDLKQCLQEYVITSKIIKFIKTVTTLRWKEIILTLTPTHLSNSDIGLTSTPKGWASTEIRISVFICFLLMFSILLGRKVMFLLLHSLFRFKNTSFYRMYNMSLCHLWCECKMVLKEVHLGQPSWYARKTCIFSGLVMKVLHTSLVDMLLMMKTPSPQLLWQMEQHKFTFLQQENAHTVSENCSLCCTKHLIPHRRANCLKFHTHTHTHTHFHKATEWAKTLHT